MMNVKRNTHLFDLYWEDILVTKVMPHLDVLECFKFRCVSKTCQQIVNMYFSKMKSLKLMNKGFSPHTFKVFTDTCRRLQLLNLSRCSCIQDAELIPMLLLNRGLVHLNLSQCKNLTAKCLQPVILYCQKLRHLKLAKCAWLTTGAMEALALHQSNLEQVDLSYCSSISEGCILVFLKKFQYIRSLNLEGNRQVSDKCLYTIAKYSKGLRLLNLAGCYEITDKGVNLKGHPAHSIHETIDLILKSSIALVTNFKRGSFEALAIHSVKLEGLLVRGCHKVTENSLRMLRDKVYLDRKPVVAVPRPIYIQI